MMTPAWLQSDRNKILLGILMVFSLIGGYVFQFPFYQNCINIKFHVFSYLLIGGGIGIGTGYFLGKELHFLIEKFQLIVGCLFAGLILSPLLFTLVNRFIPSGQTIATETEIQRVDEYSQSRFGELEGAKSVDGIYVYFLVENQPFRLSAAPEFDRVKHHKGSLLPINIHQGIFGLKWVSLRMDQL